MNYYTAAAKHVKTPELRRWLTLQSCGLSDYSPEVFVGPQDNPFVRITRAPPHFIAELVEARDAWRPPARRERLRFDRQEFVASCRRAGYRGEPRLILSYADKMQEGDSPDHLVDCLSRNLHW